MREGRPYFYLWKGAIVLSGGNEEMEPILIRTTFFLIRTKQWFLKFLLDEKVSTLAQQKWMAKLMGLVAKPRFDFGGGLYIYSSYIWYNFKQHYIPKYFLIESKFWQTHRWITSSLYIPLVCKFSKQLKINSHVINQSFKFKFL